MFKIDDIKKGSHLREFRKSLKLSQESFGQVIDYRLNRISVIERTDAPIPTKMFKNIKIHIRVKK